MGGHISICTIELWRFWFGRRVFCCGQGAVQSGEPPSPPWCIQCRQRVPQVDGVLAGSAGGPSTRPGRGPQSRRRSRKAAQGSPLSRSTIATTAAQFGRTASCRKDVSASANEPRMNSVSTDAVLMARFSAALTDRPYPHQRPAASSSTTPSRMAAVKPMMSARDRRWSRAINDRESKPAILLGDCC